MSNSGAHVPKPTLRGVIYGGARLGIAVRIASGHTYEFIYDCGDIRVLVSHDDTVYDDNKIGVRVSRDSITLVVVKPSNRAGPGDEFSRVLCEYRNPSRAVYVTISPELNKVGLAELVQALRHFYHHEDCNAPVRVVLGVIHEAVTRRLGSGGR